MNNLSKIEFRKETLESKIVDNFVLLKFKGGSFHSLTDLNFNNEILPWFDLVDKEPEIKGVLILNENESFGEESYHTFLTAIAENQDVEVTKIERFKNPELRAIEINMLINYIRKIMKIKKLIVFGLQGSVVTPFFGVTLSGDYRIVNENFCYSFSHLKYGIHPSGALPFFLQKYVGIGKAEELLLLGKRLCSSEANKLGLVNEVLSDDNFEEKAIARMKELCQIDESVVISTKTLMFDLEKELLEYFERESHFLYK